jgi:exosortase/archaeosortase family protein
MNEKTIQRILMAQPKYPYRSPRGVAFLPDQGEATPEPPRPPYPVALRVAIFLCIFAGLQALWGFARGTAVERLVIESATVEPAVALINLLTPASHAVAAGTRIRAPDGGINILNGCEGTEVLFLLIAAFSVAPVPARVRLSGLAVGTAAVFLLNQGRILCLFYAFRADAAIFDLLHTVVAPIMLVCLTTIFFYAWIKGDRAAAPA